VTCPKFESRPRFPSQKLCVGVTTTALTTVDFRKMAGFAQSSYTVRVHQRRRPFSRVFWPRASPESQPLFSPPTSSNVFPLCLSCEGVPFGVCIQEKPRSGICKMKCIFIWGARAKARFGIPRDVSGEWIRHSNFRSTG